MRKKSLILLTALLITFTAAYLVAQVDGEEEFLFDVQGMGATITSQWLTIAPTIDGFLSPGEWADAAAYDISNTAGGITAGTVTMYVKNDGSYLYIAVDDTNDTFTVFDGADQVGVYFDDVGGLSPVLYDNLWTNASCGNATGEGGIIIGTLSPVLPPIYDEWTVGPTQCTEVPQVAGVTQGVSLTSGHMQYEATYHLANSPLNALPGDTIGFHIYSYDGDAVPTSITTGNWPLGVTRSDPSTYGNLIMAQPYYVTHTSDFTGDMVSDGSIYRPMSGIWFVKGGGAYSIGGTTDIPATGDYDGDGITDVATWDAGTWSFRYSSSTMRDMISYGTAGDIPVPGDYDGDGMTDVAVWRPSNGTWYIRGIRVRTYGIAGDLPVPGDYDGDGTTDLAVWRPSNGTWYVLGWGAVTYGNQGDIPVPGDYNGLGQTDIALWRPSSGIWFVRYSELGNRMAMTYGISGDIPVPADYNGDGITDPACWRPTNGIWYLKGIGAVTYGIQGDYPTIR